MAKSIPIGDNPMTERFDDYQLRLPRCDHFVRAIDDVNLQHQVPLRDGREVTLPLPLFWFDPPWQDAPVERCLAFAHQLAAAGITVSAIGRELSQQDDDQAAVFFPRMATHRCDRAGWVAQDFENAAIIELRLALIRDRDGRVAYDTRQQLRWANAPDAESDQVIASRNAMSFPPEWDSLDDMIHKVANLRKLSQAAVFVSLDAANEQWLVPAAIRAGVDGVIVVYQGDDASLIARTAQRIHAEAGDKPPQLWVVSTQATDPQTWIKCLALGADAIAVDAFCNEHLFGSKAANDSIEQTVLRWRAELSGYTASCGVSQLSELNDQHLHLPSALQSSK